MTASGLLLLLYLLASLLSVRAWYVARLGRNLACSWSGPNRRRRRRDTAYRISMRIWLGVAVAFALLAFNKAYDVYTPTANAIRHFAYGIGLEQDRRVFQVIALTGIALAMIVLLRTLPRWIQLFAKRHRFIIIISIILACYVVARAISYHYLDAVLYADILGIRVRSAVETILTALAIVAAIRFSSWAQLLPFHPTARPPDCMSVVDGNLLRRSRRSRSPRT